MIKKKQDSLVIDLDRSSECRVAYTRQISERIIPPSLLLAKQDCVQFVLMMVAFMSGHTDSGRVTRGVIVSVSTTDRNNYIMDGSYLGAVRINSSSSIVKKIYSEQS